MSKSVMFTEEWLRDYCARTGKTPREPNAPRRPETSPTAKSKYGNRKTQRGGRVFDSEHEARVYDEIDLLWKSGGIRGFSCQVPFLLPGGVKYIADFVTMENDGRYAVLDAKSEATRKDKAYCIKKRLMRECLGIEIREV